MAFWPAVKRLEQGPFPDQVSLPPADPLQKYASMMGIRTDGREKTRAVVLEKIVAHLKPMEAMLNPEAPPQISLFSYPYSTSEEMILKRTSSIIEKSNCIFANMIDATLPTHVRCNGIPFVPEALTQFKGKIVRFDQQNAGFEIFPSGISEMNHLEELYLGGNSLTELPADIEKLKDLQYIELSNNSFSCIPSILLRLPALLAFRLSSNPITFPDAWEDFHHLKDFAEEEHRANPERFEGIYLHSKRARYFLDQLAIRAKLLSQSSSPFIQEDTRSSVLDIILKYWE
jgi:hypothetical protein